MEYPKVLTLGSYQTERALLGEVSVQEKVDGSQFRFWVNMNGEVEYGSHHRQIHVGENYGMFKQAVEYLESIKNEILKYQPCTYFFCEYLAKPKQNCLAYSRVPENNLILFDMYIENNWVPHNLLKYHAGCFHIDVIPSIKIGETSVEELRSFFDRESFLGGEKIEGVVVKNYKEDIMIGGKLRPTFVKMVRPEFKEKMVQEQARQGEHGLIAFLNTLRSEARWEKAIQYLKENDIYTASPKDIGNLIQRVHKDIEEEEKDNVQEYLWKEFKRQIFNKSTAGLPEWYKEQLLKRLEDGKEEIKS